MDLKRGEHSNHVEVSCPFHGEERSTVASTSGLPLDVIGKEEKRRGSAAWWSVAGGWAIINHMGGWAESEWSKVDERLVFTI